MLIAKNAREGLNAMYTSRERSKYNIVKILERVQNYNPKKVMTEQWFMCFTYLLQRETGVELDYYFTVPWRNIFSERLSDVLCELVSEGALHNGYYRTSTGSSYAYRLNQHLPIHYSDELDVMLCEEYECHDLTAYELGLIDAFIERHADKLQNALKLESFVFMANDRYQPNTLTALCHYTKRLNSAYTDEDIIEVVEQHKSMFNTELREILAK